MRKLTIKREKSFVGCLGKYKVLAEDNVSGTITIGDSKYSLIGTLKNGEEKSFEIENSACKIAVIAGKMSKDYCCDIYPVDEGDEDVYLSGKAEYDPVRGNPFKFRNNNSAIAVSNRNKGTKIGVIVLIVAVVVGGTIGFLSTALPALIEAFGSVSQPKDFTVDRLTITLTEDFRESDEYKDIEGYEDTVFLKTDYTYCFIDNVKYNGDEEFKAMSLMDYTEYVSSFSPVEKWPEIEEGDGFLYYEYVYVDEETGDQYYNLVAVYKCDTSFYIVNFETMNENKSSFYDKLMECFESVTIK